LKDEDVKESQALIANDLRVLTAQLNEAMEAAAKRGLRVEVDVSTVLHVRERAFSCPTLAVRVLSEVQ
jgi:hypothetical protein